jgi:NAD(P)-dependent dehydrogenase (short-subunit alcohol dehydrogenase family)
MKTWFITGASRGFGALITERALAKGDAVVATARNPQAVVDRFGAHPNLLAVALDVSNEERQPPLPRLRSIDLAGSMFFSTMQGSV